MPTYHTYNVIPTLPAALEPLREMVFNLWWTWEPAARRVFRHLDPELWNRTNHNPVRMLQLSRQARLIEVAQDKNFLRELKEVHDAYRNYLARKDTYGKTGAGRAIQKPVAYFSAEFGFHESIPNYSGGLGILAGDHIKAASDLGIPLVGIGLYYDQGYFKQRFDKDGYQQEDYLDVDSKVLPLQPAKGPDGNPVTIWIETRTGAIASRVWKLSVGRTTLLLLDSDVPGNQPEDRELTARLYGGDDRVRIRQELILGVGGVRALQALDIAPGVVHLNEGHSAFAALELARQLMAAEGIAADEALRRISSRIVFTTHTPVPAGHDRFSPALIEEHLGPLRETMGLCEDDLMALARLNP